MVKVFDLSKFLKDYENLENSIYDILEKHKDCAQKIVNEIKGKFFSKIEKAEDKLFFSSIINDIIACYFDELLQEDFIKFL